MDRNSIIGLVLIFAIVVGSFFLNRPSEEEILAQKKFEDSVALVKKQQDSIFKAKEAVASNEVKSATPDSSISMQSDSSLISSKFGVFASATLGENKTYTIENELIKVYLSSKGGAPVKVELKEYKRHGAAENTPLELFNDKESDFSIRFATNDNRQINSSDLFFDSKLENVTLNGDSTQIELISKINENQFIKQTYTLRKGSYLVGWDLNLVGLDQLLSATTRYLLVDWKIELPLQEKEIEAEQKVSTVYFRSFDEEVDYLSETKYTENKLNYAVNWVSFKQQYFNSTLIARNFKGFEDMTVATEEPVSTGHIKTLKTNFVLPYNFGSNELYKSDFYFGPNKYDILDGLDVGLERIIPLGWGIFRWANQFLVIPIFTFLTDHFNNYGLVIFLLTLIMKTLLFALVYKSFISSTKMRLLKPEMEAIKEKFGDDAQKVQVENMKLFKLAGVSPLGGCLPMVLQMPILIGLFYFFPTAIELRQESFLWASDLSIYDSVLDLGFSIPFYGNHVSLFTILMTISTLIYTYMNNQLTGVTGQMKYIGYIMPVVFLGVFNTYASGLTYYYFLNNVIAFAQQFIMKRFVNEDKLHAQIQENKKKPAKKSSFQARLEEMMKNNGRPKK